MSFVSRRLQNEGNNIVKTLFSIIGRGLEDKFLQALVQDYHQYFEKVDIGNVQRLFLGSYRIQLNLEKDSGFVVRVLHYYSDFVLLEGHGKNVFWTCSKQTWSNHFFK